MAITVVPGYDFGVNEVPDRETLLRQARFLQVSGLDLSHIDATLIGYKGGDTSGTTSASLPSPGWMWADPGGSVWVETDHGPVKLHRDGGGFETVRWGQTFAPETAVPRPGHPWSASPAVAGAQHTDGVNLSAGDSGALGMWDEGFIDSANGAVHSRNAMLSAETVATTASFPRLVGRGITLIYIQGTQTPLDFTTRTPAAFRVLTTNNHWSGAFISAFSNVIGGLDREVWYGMFLAPHSGTSHAANVMHDTCFGWKFDAGLAGPGDAI